MAKAKREIKVQLKNFNDPKVRRAFLEALRKYYGGR